MREFGGFVVPGPRLGGAVDTLLRRLEPMIDRQNTAQAIVEAGRKKAEKTRAMLLDIGWPPPWHLPARTLDEVVRSYHRGAITVDEVVHIVLELYDRGTLERLVAEWAQFEWLAPRLPAIREGIGSYKDGRYYAAVCTLLPHVEGVLEDVMEKRPNVQNDAEKFFRDSPLSSVAKEYLVKVWKTGFGFGPAEPVPEMSRNAILHGRDLSYGTKAHALRTILVLDAVLGAADERRRDAEEAQRLVGDTSDCDSSDEC
jgi:hypothetical protein